METWDGAMGLVAHGYGDRGMIDTFHGEIELLMCETCSRDLLTNEKWLSPALEALNINYGHRCVNGEVLWEPMSSCERDPDRHGWREVWSVGPSVAAPAFKRAPLVTKNGKLAVFGVFDTEEEAAARCAELVAEGCAARVRRGPLGNSKHHSEVVDWQEFWKTWEAENRRFKRRRRVRTVLMLPRTMVWVMRRALREVRRRPTADGRLAS